MSVTVITCTVPLKLVESTVLKYLSVKVQCLSFDQRCIHSSPTRQPGLVLELTDLQRTLAVLSVQDVWSDDVIQSIVLQGWRGRVKLGSKGQRVGRAVSRSRADGANPFCCRLQRYRWAFMETVLFNSEQKTSNLN